ncbi:MAG TPA: indole-3-glycerol phosphate synthase TrpC, partial [Chondromyces sp.]|nr:indole-3-glycerol phosphate synthase TrpC [Chondromyces sp.]
SDILEKILIKKEEEVARLKKTFVKKGDGEQLAHPSIFELFKQSDRMNIIAEMKRASPSKGDIKVDADPVAQAGQYESYGADAISVLTDEPFFKGNISDLEAIRKKVNLPILNKDFIIDPIQIDRANQAGADVILLIAAALTDKKLADLYKYATDLQLNVLLEVHNEEEMERALKLKAPVIGINNRDLKTFHVSLEVTERLLARYGNQETIFISESGIRTREDVERVRDAGAKGILVGETLMQASNIRQTIEELKVPFEVTT